MVTTKAFASFAATVAFPRAARACRSLTLSAPWHPREQERVKPVPLRILRYLTLPLVLALLSVNPTVSRAQGISATGPTATFGAGGTLTGYSVNLTSVPGGALPAGTTVFLQYTTGAGTPIGGPVTATVGAGGVLTVPPPAIPPGATGLGNKVVISLDRAGVLSTAPLVWYSSGWIWKTNTIKVDPLGIPGLTPSQSWFIQETAAPVEGTSDVFGTVNPTVVASNFDLSYVPLGGNLFEAFVSGNNSFMTLDDETSLRFLNGSSFGTIQILSQSAAAATGLFNFTAIGLAGSWIWDSVTNYTGGTGTPTPGGFSTPAITASVVPEPASITLLSVGLIGLVGCAARRRRKNADLAALPR